MRFLRFMKFFIRPIYIKLRGLIIAAHDKIGSKYVCLNIYDLLMKQEQINALQFLIASRYLDICNYYSNNGSGNEMFPWQTEISTRKYGAAYPKEKGDRIFTELIKSYETNGYQEESIVKVDDHFRVLDGTHRIALHIYFDIETINVKVLPRSVESRANISEFLRLGLAAEKVQTILMSYQKILSEKMNAQFIAIISEDIQEHWNEILADFSLLSNVKSYGDALGEEKKRMILFDLDNPVYRKQKNGMPYSKRAKEIEEIINSRYIYIYAETSMLLSLYAG